MARSSGTALAPTPSRKMPRRAVSAAESIRNARYSPRAPGPLLRGLMTRLWVLARAASLASEEETDETDKADLSALATALFGVSLVFSESRKPGLQLCISGVDGARGLSFAVEPEGRSAKDRIVDSLRDLSHEARQEFVRAPESHTLSFWHQLLSGILALVDAEDSSHHLVLVPPRAGTLRLMLVDAGNDPRPEPAPQILVNGRWVNLPSKKAVRK